MATVEERLPKAFLEEIRELLPAEEYRAFLDSFEQERTYGLRRNCLYYEQAEFEAGMPFDLTPISGCPEGYYYDPLQRPGKSAYHEAGAFYIQEPSAMKVVELLDPKPGDIVCDLCAAPGGKSTQIAGKLMGQGLLISNEYVEKRARILAQNLERMGGYNSIVLNEDTGKLRQYFPGFFDKIVIDAPCSGEGMFRKDEIAISEWSTENVQICAKRQKEILENGADMLKPGGVLVYSTCTFSKAEDEDVISAFLETHPDFSVDLFGRDTMLSVGGVERGMKGAYTYYFHKTKGEGHFICRLVKEDPFHLCLEEKKESVLTVSGEINLCVPEAKSEKRKEKEKLAGKRGKSARCAGKTGSGDADREKDFEAFCKECLTDSYLEHLHKEGRFIWQKDNLYWFSHLAPSLDGLRVVTPGLLMGCAKKGRFEPEHALAMTLRETNVKASVEASDPEKYLRGESIESSRPLKGWVLVTLQGKGMGWGKASGCQIKNHYPKGIRRP